MITLEKGNKAPDFSGHVKENKTISLGDFKGNKLVLFFYPKDDTPGCTKEACNLRDNYALLQDHGIKVVGISPDNLKKHDKFIHKYELPFPLIADTEKEIIEAYGVWGPKKFMGKEYDGLHRTTFVIDEVGNIELVIKKVKTKAHAEQILEELGIN